MWISIFLKCGGLQKRCTQSIINSISATVGKENVRGHEHILVTGQNRYCRRRDLTSPKIDVTRPILQVCTLSFSTGCPLLHFEVYQVINLLHILNSVTQVLHFLFKLPPFCCSCLCPAREKNPDSLSGLAPSLIQWVIPPGIQKDQLYSCMWGIMVPCSPVAANKLQSWRGAPTSISHSPEWPQCSVQNIISYKHTACIFLLEADRQNCTVNKKEN